MSAHYTIIADMKSLGAVACGHPETANAAEMILREGGNAFDAILAAHFMACVVEPVLASLAGGGFLFTGTEPFQKWIRWAGTRR